MPFRYYPVKPYDVNDVGDYLRFLKEWAMLGVEAFEDGPQVISDRQITETKKEIEGVYSCLRTLI